ncbi:MAG: GNAT family N-acetyltransferase [Hyphomicrobiales bacterium]
MVVRALNYTLDSSRPDGAPGEGTIRRGTILGRKGRMLVRLAAGAREIEAAQALRYKVFYEELDARPSAEMLANRRDADEFDDICDHLLVMTPPGESGETSPIMVDDGEVVGTYRLLRQEVAQRNGGFYSADEFDIDTLLKTKGDKLRFLELGRSCVLESFRTKLVIELLWQGIWNYVQAHSVDVMLGCASLEGTDPEALALPLSFLHHVHRAPDEWRVRAVPERYVEMGLLPVEEIDEREAMRTLPPLIKGYVRAGAYIGEGAVVDHQFNTTDVLIVLPVTAISARYVSHFAGSDDARDKAPEASGEPTPQP